MNIAVTLLMQQHMIHGLREQCLDKYSLLKTVRDGISNLSRKNQRQ
jgi:hypothetical protein